MKRLILVLPLLLGGCATRESLIYLEGHAAAYREMWEQTELWNKAYKAALNKCAEERSMDSLADKAASETDHELREELRHILRKRRQ